MRVYGAYARAGFLVRPAIITPEQCATIREQVIAINRNPNSLPPHHRNVPGGPASLLIDHPAVLGVLHEIIGKDVRLESPGCVVREQGQRHGELHGGGPQQIDPIFGYRESISRVFCVLCVLWFLANLGVSTHRVSCSNAVRGHLYSVLTRALCCAVCQLSFQVPKTGRFMLEWYASSSD